MTDLDRAYVINGDDLRIALTEAKQAVGDGPRDVAEWIIGKHAQPLGDVKADITRARLAAALAKTRLGIEQVEEWRFGPTAVPSRPDELARALLARIEDREAEGDVVDAHICCEHADHAPGPFADPEVAAMAALAPALAALRRLKHDEAMRVMRWATDRATGNLPPF